VSERSDVTCECELLKSLYDYRKLRQNAVSGAGIITDCWSKN